MVEEDDTKYRIRAHYTPTPKDKIDDSDKSLSISLSPKCGRWERRISCGVGGGSVVYDMIRLLHCIWSTTALHHIGWRWMLGGWVLRKEGVNVGGRIIRKGKKCALLNNIRSNVGSPQITSGHWWVLGGFCRRTIFAAPFSSDWLSVMSVVDSQ
jgi:hypothetical protein